MVDNWNARTLDVQCGISRMDALIAPIREMPEGDSAPEPIFFWGLFSTASHGPIEQVAPFLDACVERGASLYDRAGLLAKIQDPAKLRWWLNQGGDPTVLDVEGDPLWFGLINHARVELLEVLAEQPLWQRWSCQRHGHDQAGALHHWAFLESLTDLICGGPNPDLSADHDLAVALPRGRSMPFQPGAIPMGSQERITRTVNVWRWLVERLPEQRQDSPDVWWPRFWQSGLDGEPLMLEVWQCLRTEHALQTTPALHAMNEAWSAFQEHPNSLKNPTLMKAWAMGLERDRLHTVAPSLDYSPHHERVRL